jgi:hypothetical protein
MVTPGFRNSRSGPARYSPAICQTASAAGGAGASFGAAHASRTVANGSTSKKGIELVRHFISNLTCGDSHCAAVESFNALWTMPVPPAGFHPAKAGQEEKSCCSFSAIGHTTNGWSENSRRDACLAGNSKRERFLPPPASPGLRPGLLVGRGGRPSVRCWTGWNGPGVAARLTKSPRREPGDSA